MLCKQHERARFLQTNGLSAESKETRVDRWAANLLLNKMRCGYHGGQEERTVAGARKSQMGDIGGDGGGCGQAKQLLQGDRIMIKGK